jgi:hypothetical protein
MEAIHMEEKPAPQTTLEELLGSFGDLLKRYEDGVSAFTTAVDAHVRALEHDPLLEALESHLGAHEQRLKAFGDSLKPGLDRLDRELDATMSKCNEMLANVENKKHELAQAITQISTGLQTDTHLNLVDKAGVVDDLSDAVHGLSRIVGEWFNLNKVCHDLLYTRIEKHEALLASDEKLVASLTILIKMREELIHTRLEKREQFLKSTEDLLKSFSELIVGYQTMIKETDGS